MFEEETLFGCYKKKFRIYEKKFGGFGERLFWQLRRYN
ncbi:MAG: hypothetical protein RJB10_115 [Pseudomonadota bacterium]|jgi:hypothetical protein